MPIPMSLVILAALSQVPAKFERIVIDDHFPGGYQVEVADVNGDKKPDIVALGGSTLAWYENPTWKKRVISTSKETPDIISSATLDLDGDGDGKAEIAVAYDFAMNEPKRGKLLLAIQGATVDDPWTFRPIVADRATPPESTGKLPSIHRLRWGIIPPVDPVSSSKKMGLFVAPIFGPSAKPPTFQEEPAHLIVFEPGPEPKSGRWQSMLVGMAPVLHAIEVVDLGTSHGFSTVLGASNLGLSHFQPGEVIPGDRYRRYDLTSGAPGEAPRKGASEVHLGRFKDGRKFVATVEPWHGTDVVLYQVESLKQNFMRPHLKLGPREVIDSTLKEGHALWVADVDGDGDDEVFAGYRGGTGGVNLYDFDGSKWTRSVLDPGVTAQDLRGGDIDGDGTPDVVAIGGKSHNVVWYKPIRSAK